MNKKILIRCIVIIALITLAPFSSVAGAIDVEDEKLIRIRTTVSQITGIEESEIRVSEEEAQEIISILKDLSDAIANDDTSKILQCESVLKEKKVIGNHQNVQFQKDVLGKISKMVSCPYDNSQSLSSNSFNSPLCITQFSGDIYDRGEISTIIFDGFLLFLVLLAMWGGTGVLLSLAFAIMIITGIIHIVQTNRIFRLGIPYAGIGVRDGNLSTWGLNGHETITGWFSFVLFGFFGIQIQIWTEKDNRYLFLSGISLNVRFPNE